MSNEKPFQQFYRHQLTGSYFKCIKCKDTGLRIEVNEYVPCECEAGKQLRERANIGNSELPSIPAVHSSLELLELSRTDAERLRAIAATMSYDAKGSEPDNKHTLYEIAMRLETGYYNGSKA